MAGTSLKGWQVLPLVLVGVMDVCGSWHGREAVAPSSCSSTFPSLWTEASLSGGHPQIPNVALVANFFQYIWIPIQEIYFLFRAGRKTRSPF